VEALLSFHFVSPCQKKKKNNIKNKLKKKKKDNIKDQWKIKNNIYINYFVYSRNIFFCKKNSLTL